MILFTKDWVLQNAFPNWKTTNQTFVELAVLLRNMGVKNCNFHLALHDRELIGKDPHADPNTLGQELMSRMILECQINPWYYFREVFRVPTGGNGIPLRANRANLAMWWLFYTHVVNIQIQPRQTGKSLCADALNTEEMLFRTKGTEINLITKDDDLRKRNISRLKEILDCLPRWMDFRNRSDANNSEFITINLLGNKLNTFVPRNDERQAEKLCRGFSSPIHFYDELPFQSYCAIGYPASVSAMDARVDEAKTAGTDYGIVITTTAHKKDDRDGKFVYNMITGACKMDERLYDIENEKKLHDVIRANNSNGGLLVYSCYNHRQLGYTDEWLVEKMRNSQGTPEAIARDYLCKWTSGTATSPFTAKVSEQIRLSERRVEHLEITQENYVINWYLEDTQIERFMATRKCVMGLDTSEASGGDDIGMYMFDTRTGKVVATAKINETNIITFAQWLANFLIKYPNVILNPERRSTGSSVVDYLLQLLPSKGVDPFKRIFNTVVHEHDTDKTRYEEMVQASRRGGGDILTRFRKLFGFATSGSGMMARNKLYSDTLFLIVKKLNGNFGDVHVINQLLGLVYRNGRIDHDKDGHDDMVVAMLLSYWFLLFGKNLSYYGITPDEIFTELDDGSAMTPKERQQVTEQKKLREELERIAEEYTGCRDPIRMSRLELTMRNIERKLVLESNEINTVDELIRKVREERTKHRHEMTRQNTRDRLQTSGIRRVDTTTDSSYDRFVRR